MLFVRHHFLRLLLPAVALLWCAGDSRLAAQDAPLPLPATQDPAPLEPTPAPAATANPAPPQLIPADVLPMPDPAAPAPELLPDIPTIEQLDQGMSPPPLSPAAQARQNHIEWRKLRNQVQNEPRVKAALAEADAAKTDLQRRKLLARYIEIYHARMIALAPEMKQYLLDRKREQLAALPQPRVRPETAPKPTPTPAVTAAAASPSPSGTPPTSAAAYASPSPSPSASSLFPRFSRP